MADLGLSAGPGFLLLAAFLYYAGGFAALLAFVTAALAHELGHLTAIAAAGAHVTALRLTAAGPVISFAGELTPRQELGIAAAGPTAGLLFAGACMALDTPYFRYAGLIALLASAFNLLPALPLDGGRLALLLMRETMPAETAERWMRVVGSICAAGVAVTGAYLRSPAALAAGIWLAVLVNRPELR